MGPEEHGGVGSQASDRTGIELINGSPEPVYRLLVAIVRIQGAGSPSSIESWLEREEEEREKRQHWTKEDYEKHWPLLTVPITTASILPSGRYRVWLQGIWGRGMGERHGAEVAFTDRAGSHWVRRATGKLEELGEDPITHYRGAGPHDLQMPERLT